MRWIGPLSRQFGGGGGVVVEAAAVVGFVLRTGSERERERERESEYRECFVFGSEMRRC